MSCGETNVQKQGKKHRTQKNIEIYFFKYILKLFEYNYFKYFYNLWHSIFIQI